MALTQCAAKESTMMRISTFYTVSSTLVALALSANSVSAGDHKIHPSNGSGVGAGAGKIPVTGAGYNGQTPVPQAQGDMDRPYVLGSEYNGGGNATTRRLKDKR
jgi:hypothetical protein